MKILKVKKDEILFPGLLVWLSGGYVVRHPSKEELGLSIIGQADKPIKEK